MIEKLKTQNIGVIIAASLLIVGALIGIGFGIKTILDVQRREAAPLFSYTGDASWKSNETKKESLTLFSESSEEAGSQCFVHVEYVAGSLNSDAQTKKYLDALLKGGHPTEAIGTQKLALKTAAGNKEYELKQYRVANAPDVEPIMESAQIGYVKLSDGYARIVGNCDTLDQLPMTLPVLKAVSYRKS